MGIALLARLGGQALLMGEGHMRDAFGVERVSKGALTYEDKKGRKRVDTPTNVAVAGGVGGALGMTAGEGVRGLREARTARADVLRENPTGWKGISRLSRGKQLAQVGLNPGYRAAMRPGTAGAIAGGALAGAGVGYGAKKLWGKKEVAKYDKSRAAAGAVVGAGGAGGAVAGGRALWNADHLPASALNKPEQALRRGRHPGPMVRDHFAVSGKGKTEPVYRMLGDAKAPSRLEGMARHIPNGAGRLGLLSKPKAAAVVVSTGVATGGAAGLVHRRNKDRTVHL